MNTVYKLYNMLFTECTRAEYDALSTYNEHTQYIVTEPDESISLYLGDRSLTSANDFTDADALKLEGIETGAQVNVQSDWDETDESSDAYIKNKPNLDISDTGITISGPIRSSNSNYPFNATDYSQDDLALLTANIGKATTESTQKFDFYRDSTINEDDKVILENILSGDFKSFITNVTSYLTSKEQHKLYTRTRIYMVPNVCPVTNNPNTSDLKYAYFDSEIRTGKFCHSFLNKKFFWKDSYSSADLLIVDNIINNNITPTIEQLNKYDINQNGEIDSNDRAYINNFINGDWAVIQSIRNNSFNSDRYGYYLYDKSKGSDLITTRCTIYYKTTSVSQGEDLDNKLSINTAFESNIVETPESAVILDSKNINIDKVNTNRINIDSQSITNINTIITSSANNNSLATSEAILNYVASQQSLDEKIANKDTTINSNSTNSHYPTSLAVFNFVSQYNNNVIFESSTGIISGNSFSVNTDDLNKYKLYCVTVAIYDNGAFSDEQNILLYRYDDTFENNRCVLGLGTATNTFKFEQNYVQLVKTNVIDSDNNETVDYVGTKMLGNLTNYYYDDSFDLRLLKLTGIC